MEFRATGTGIYHSANQATTLVVWNRVYIEFALIWSHCTIKRRRFPTQRQPDRSALAAVSKHGRSMLKLGITFLSAAIAGVVLAPATVNAAQSGISSAYSAEHGTKLKDHASAHRSGSKVRVAKRSAKSGIKRSAKSGIHSTKRGTKKMARGKRLKQHAGVYRSASKVRVSKHRAAAASYAGSQNGIASVYSTKHGTKTASGARLSDHALTAAHRSLPFGSKVHVTNHKNGKSVIVTITDRGPFIRGRIIDLTPAGARALGFNGLAPVTVRVAG